jgi:hypothetical protein
MSTTFFQAKRALESQITEINLRILEFHLRSEKLQEDFDMSVYPKGFASTCETAGCALAHATFAVEPLLLSESWEHYRDRIFPGLTDKENAWIFGGLWWATDNTPLGAAERIRILLFEGVPDDSYLQMIGKVPLSYTQEIPHETI